MAAPTFNPFLSGQQQIGLYDAQQQQALGQALLDQGITPLSTTDRQIGGVGYAISPLEGLAKIGQTLAGSYAKKNANKALVDALMGKPSRDETNTTKLDDGRTINWDRPRDGDQVGLVYGQSQGSQPQQSTGIASLPPELQRLAQIYPEVAVKALFDRASPQYDPRVQGAIEGSKTRAQSENKGEYKETDKGLQFVYPPAGQANSYDGLPQPSSNPSFGNLPPLPAGALQQGAEPMPAAGTPPPPPATAFDATGGAMGAQVDAQGNQAPPRLLTQAEIEQRKAEAGVKGKDIAEAEQGVATVESRFDNAKDVISQLIKLAPKTSYGLLPETQQQFENAINSPRSEDNASFENLKANLLTQQLPAIVKSTGGRIDIPLLNAIKDAESIQLEDSPRAKTAVLNNLSKLLDMQRQNAHNLVGNVTGNKPTTPQNYTTPQQALEELRRRGKIK